ncbi:MAG: DNA topoisomerase VI subunit B [Thermoplasmata archaeon]
MAVKSIAERLAQKQREISVSEFFERNKHILGFDSLTRALITSVKEGVENSLDAAEEAGILPDICVELERISRNEYRVIIEDNGPGIVKRVVPKIFGKLLYGSRFHSLRQARGAQGIGISAVVMYAQLTTGRPAKIRTKVKEKDVAYEVELMLDTKKNRPLKVRDDFVVWDKPHGTRFEAVVRGRYVTGKQSVYEYLRATAIVNPHARIEFRSPNGDDVVFDRATEELPELTKEIKPHPYGMELGMLMKMAKYTKSIKMVSFLKTEFERISYRVAREICRKAEVPEDLRPKKLSLEQGRAIIGAIKKVKIMSPPTDCLSPIGERLIRKGLKNVLGDMKPEFYCPPVTREPSVFAGNPFVVEVGIVYGGDLPADQPVEVLRYANRVPLLYQQGGCALTAGLEQVDWRRYGLEQRGGRGLPFGPAIILVHLASTKVPFTSEAKDAVANIPAITEEIKRGLMACGRRLRTHLNKKKKRAKTQEKFEIVQKILPEIAVKSAGIIHKKVPSLDRTITKIMDVIWIDEHVEYSKRGHRVTIDVYNYTPTAKKLTLHAVIPNGNLDTSSMTPKPNEVKDNGKVTWTLKRIPSSKKQEVSFTLSGLDQDDYDETELYVSGINPQYVIGAEALPGDWDIEVREFKRLDVEEVAAEDEVDYDEIEEVVEELEEDSYGKQESEAY